MGYTITNVHTKMWESTIRYLAEQADSRLRPWCQERVGPTASRSWGRMAPLEFAAKGSRGTNTAVASPISDTQYTGRVASVASYCSSDLIERDEIEQVAFDPQAAVLHRLAAGARRYIDKILIAAATAAALDDAGASQAFDTGQVAGDYSKPLDFALINAVNAQFLKKNVPPEEEKVFVIGPNQVMALFAEARATSNLYVDQKSLPEGGFIKKFMGFNFIVSNLLTAPATGQLQCLAFTKKALGLQITKDIWVEAMVDPSASMAWRIYSEFTAGAVRVEDEQLVQVQVADTFIAA